MNRPHVPVLLDNVLAALGDLGGRSVVDATFGAGGYSRAFLERGAGVVAFDRDESVAPFADALKKEFGEKFEFINAKFSSVADHVSGIDAIVFDFGVSSMQLDRPERGFSWRFDAPLGMNMGRGPSALDLIGAADAAGLAKMLRDFGDVKKAAAIARAIKTKNPRTTFELRDLIFDPKDAARVFQALRIAVNDELEEIAQALASVPSLLCGGGICACVSFHSLESRLVRNTFREWTNAPGDPRLPCSARPQFRLIANARPSKAELGGNPRARSGQLRAVMKL
jgi:16S rRNA (cytosine1402-N4)-methyltransferase